MAPVGGILLTTSLALPSSDFCSDKLKKNFNMIQPIFQQRKKKA